MSRITVGTPGQRLIVPDEFVEAMGLAEGEEVEVEIHDGEILLRRPNQDAEKREKALAAVERIKEMRKGMTMGGLSIRELIDEGRR
jgi:antitoxin component of MazEF toxin-antitoxin module